MFNCWKGKLSSLHTAHLSSWPPRAGTEAGATALDLVTKAGAFPSRTLVSAEAAHLVRLAAGAYSRAAHRVWSRSFRDAVLCVVIDLIQLPGWLGWWEKAIVSAASPTG